MELDECLDTSGELSRQHDEKLRESVNNIIVEEHSENNGSNNELSEVGTSVENLVVPPQPLESFMANIMQELAGLRADIQTENNKLVQKVTADITAKLEVANQELSQNLTQYFRSENEKLKTELCSKLEAEVRTLNQLIDEHKKDTEVELMKVRHTVDSEYSKVTERVKTHVTETRQQVDRVSQEVKTKTMTSLSDITEHRSQTETEINDIRQELSRAKQQLTNEWVAEIKQVTDNLADCRRQVDADKQGNISEFQKVRAEISDLKCKVAEKQAVNDQSAIRSSINLSQAEDPVNVDQTRTTAICVQNSGNLDQVSVNGMNVCGSNSNCISETRAELPSDSGINHVYASSEILANYNSLSELTLPTFTDSSTQIVVTFLRDLDQYFKLKSVPEGLKLPLASRALADPYAKSWMQAVYHDLHSYDEFKQKFMQLLWNEVRQSSVRVSIFQDRYDRRSGETMQSHFLKYAGLAANLQPPLSELDLVNALISHYPSDIQRVMLSGSLRSIQDAVAFLAKMQSLDTSRDKPRGSRQDSDSRDSNGRSPRDGYYESGASRRQDGQVRHVRYTGSGTGNSSYCQGASNRRHNNSQNGRWRYNASQSTLNTHAREFEPRTISSSRTEGPEESVRSGVPDNAAVN